MSYCIVTEWEDGTVAVTAIEGVNDAGEDLASGGEPSPEQLNRACRLVALEVEDDEDESRVHPATASELPHYYVGSLAEIGNGTPNAECYVLAMGAVTLR